ncbi:TPA: hypothetical protein ACKRQV_000021 [Pseudomonas aeruginosa]
MSSRIGTDVGDLALEMVLDDDLKNVINVARKSLKSAGGDGTICRIKTDVRKILKDLQAEGRFSKSDLALVRRRVDDAIARRLSDEFPDE